MKNEKLSDNPFPFPPKSKTNFITWQYNGQEWKAEIISAGEKESPFSAKQRRVLCYSYLIKISAGSYSATFRFYGSIADHERGAVRLSPAQLAYCCYCFLRDAEAGQYALNEFCATFGACDDIEKMMESYFACVGAAADFACLVEGHKLRQKGTELKGFGFEYEVAFSRLSHILGVLCGEEDEDEDLQEN